MNNTQILIRLPKELKEQLEKMAKEDNRSLNNMINVILQKGVRK